MGWILIVMTTAAGQVAETTSSLDMCRYRFNSIYATQTITEAYCKSMAGDIVRLYPPGHQ